mgnify:FL=1
MHYQVGNTKFCIMLYSIDFATQTAANILRAPALGHTIRVGIRVRARYAFLRSIHCLFVCLSVCLRVCIACVLERGGPDCVHTLKPR